MSASSSIHIPFHLYLRWSASVVILSFALCLAVSLLRNYDGVTSTHCKVRYLPNSLSGSIYLCLHITLVCLQTYLITTPFYAVGLELAALHQLDHWQLHSTALYLANRHSDDVMASYVGGLSPLSPLSPFASFTIISLFLP